MDINFVELMREHEHVISGIGVLVNVILTITLIILTSYAIYWNRRKDKFSFFEQSFNDLQRINEKALESDENTIAAIRSVDKNDEIDIEEARMLFFQFMRINRLFRAWSYKEYRFISEDILNSIVKSHIGVLKTFEDEIHRVLKRGYPPEFEDFLVERLKVAEALPEIGPIRTYRSNDDRSEAA